MNVDHIDSFLAYLHPAPHDVPTPLLDVLIRLLYVPTPAQE
jgi:hypothetical protein